MPRPPCAVLGRQVSGTTECTYICRPWDVHMWFVALVLVCEVGIWHKPSLVVSVHGEASYMRADESGLSGSAKTTPVTLLMCGPTCTIYGLDARCR